MSAQAVEVFYQSTVLSPTLNETLQSSSFFDPRFNHLSFFVNLWGALLGTFGGFAMHTWVFYICLVSTYLLGGGFCAIIDFLDLFPQYKIQPDRKPTAAIYWQCLKNIIKNYVFILFPLSFGNYILLHEIIGLEYTVETFPSLARMMIEIVIFFLVEDTLQYYFHRELHKPWLYQNIHKVHHHHPYPFGLTAAYAHWAEVLILAIPTYGGPLLFRPHLATMYFWILIRELDSVHTHCGYEFPFQEWISHWFPFYGGARFHDYHHDAFTCNYASRLTVFDKYHDTYREPVRRSAKKSS